MKPLLSNEEKEEFIRQRNYFTAYFKGEPLPPPEIDITELEAKWKRFERVHQVKEKLRIRRNKREDREREKEKMLAKVLNLREIDCCCTCSNNMAFAMDYVNCTILKHECKEPFQLCDKFRV